MDLSKEFREAFMKEILRIIKLDVETAVDDQIDSKVDELEERIHGLEKQFETFNSQITSSDFNNNELKLKLKKAIEALSMLEVKL